MSELRRRLALNLAVLNLRRFQWLLFAPALVLAAGQLAAWGGYWWLSGRVQAAADEGALAVRVSADPSVQEELARRAAARRLPGDARAQASRVTLQRRPEGLLVQVSYDASHWWIYGLRRILPTPPRTVVRIATAPPR
ncbi:hypothetical protein ACFODL_09730 [Phenylobacterium terrae]|uniref:Sensor histidine kinase n=1 Tax=Phenylobacterium terrae TaxID=2665495 RepID=A0ABW4N9A6_9CAUL